MHAIGYIDLDSNSLYTGVYRLLIVVSRMTISKAPHDSKQSTECV